MNSLDPRVNRLPGYGQGAILAKTPLDQFGTYEVFVQSKEGKPFQHEGIVHASDLDLAYVVAKEAFTRRFTCTSLYVVDTRNVFVSATTEGQQSAYDTIRETQTAYTPGNETFEVFHLLKRGKQHVHAGSVEAATPQDAMHIAKEKLAAGKIVFNVWAIARSAIRFTTDDDKDLWTTLPEKKYRDAADYKAGEKLTAFLQREKKNA